MVRLRLDLMTALLCCLRGIWPCMLPIPGTTFCTVLFWEPREGEQPRNRKDYMLLYLTCIPGARRDSIEKTACTIRNLATYMIGICSSNETFQL